MLALTFGEQVKIVLGRKNMTIKQLAEEIEEATGMKMSRQNLTQRLGRDNFQEKDMRMIAEILGCELQLSILDVEAKLEKSNVIAEATKAHVATEPKVERVEEARIEPATAEPKVKEEKVEEIAKEQTKEKVEEFIPVKEIIKQPTVESVEPIQPEYRREVTVEEIQPKAMDIPTEKGVGDINPYTGYEYKTNSVRTHPTRIGYVQVYDRKDHKWAEMTEWAFLGYQERQKLALGKAYIEPTYLD